MSSAMTSFAKLTETNYQRWSVQMKLTLQRDGVWRIVEGKEVKPSPAKDTDTDSTKRAIETDVRNYWTRYDRAKGTIRLGISDSVRYGAGQGGFSPSRPRRDTGQGGIF